MVKGRNARRTPKGQETFELLRGADSVLAEEKAFLGSIAPKATETGSQKNHADGAVLMKIRLRHLRLRAETAAGSFGRRHPV